MNTIELEIEGIVDSILEDYRHGRAIDKMTPKCDPDKEIIIDMIGKLMRIVYPSYSQEKTYRIYNARHNLSMLIEDVMYNLNKQIRLVLQGSMAYDEAKEKADGIIRRAETEAELEKEKAVASIKKEIVEVSTALAQKIISREINAEDHRELIDSVIEDIGDDK